MRDIVVTLFICGALPFVLRRPVIGVYLWVWVGIMNPHRLTWNWAFDLPFAQIIAIATLIGIFFNREPRRVPWTPATVTLLLLIVWMNVGMLDPLNPISAPMMWERVMKIMFMTYVALYVLNRIEHVKVLVAIVTLSVAFYGVKGGIFTLTGGGEFLVWGPAGSFIRENNSLALAMIMTIPLLYYLQLQAKDIQASYKWMQWANHKWLRLALLGSMALCLFAALGSHSRGGFLAIVAMLSFLWVKSRSKIVTGVVILLMVPFAIGFMPEKYMERMRSIENYETDLSAMGRINAWTMCYNVAKDRFPLGGGFELYTGNVFAKYAPIPDDVHTAHSIYFQILGEHGFIGLGLYLLFWFLAWRDASWIIRHTRKREGWQWASDMSRMIQVSLVGFAVGGAFLNLAYYDAPYYLMIALVLTRSLLEKEVKGEQKGWYAPGLQPGAAGAVERQAIPGAQFRRPLPLHKGR